MQKNQIHFMQKSNSYYAKIKFILCKNNKNICENQINFMRKS